MPKMHLIPEFMVITLKSQKSREMPLHRPPFQSPPLGVLGPEGTLQRDRVVGGAALPGPSPPPGLGVGSSGGLMPLLLSWPRPCGRRSQAEVPGPFTVDRGWPSFSQGPAVLTAILVIEFIYAIVGIVWLTQYYTSCNDLTAKNVTLGMSASGGGGRDRVGEEPEYNHREAVSRRDCGLTRVGPQSGGTAASTELPGTTVEGPSTSRWKPRLLCAKGGP